MSIFDPRDESMNDITDEAMTDSAQRHQQRTWPTAQDTADLKAIREAREEGGSIPLGEFLDDDPVNPPHYQGFSNGAEVIDITENLTFSGGNAVKYITRACRLDGNNKGNVREDLEKAAWYIARELDRIGGDNDEQA